MSNVVIKVENVSKIYRLGDIGTGSLGNDIKRFLARVRGKEDPFSIVAESNDRTQKGASEFVWALKDINFEINQGEVLGIIGRNGAGKSTLLKLLSRTTLPSTGEIKIKGRIASLLEVGTGFHPDLSGRDNIFLNGAILGMTKAEIKNRFDEIVDFSGVERYIDTPVKRYSSGMYVRLAFAVAAHLDPEILIVDEVLAVGDAEFQKKCLGKMKDVSGQGRTVLFVSHNMPSIRALCSSIIVMEKGHILAKGETGEMISKYLTLGITKENDVSGLIPPNLSLYNTGEGKFISAFVADQNGEMRKELYFKQPFTVSFELETYKDLNEITISVFIVNSFGEFVLMAVDNEMYKPSDYKKGNHKYDVSFSEVLMPGNYSIGLSIAYFHTGAVIDFIESFYTFKVNKETEKKDMEYPWITVHGYTSPKTKWIKK